MKSKFLPALHLLSFIFVPASFAADGTWAGAANATWSTANTNWTGVSGTPWDSTNGTGNRAVFSTAGATPVISGTVFTNGLSITNTVNISGGFLTLAGTTAIDNSADATISSIISGTPLLTKNGTATLTLSGNNTYTGGTTVTAGTLTVQNDQSSANGGWSIGPSNTATTAVNFNSGSTVAVASGKQIRIGNTSSNGGSSSTLTVAGTVTNSGTLLMGRNAALTLNSGASWGQSGDMSLTSLGGTSAALTINSGANMTYSGANTVKLNLNNSSSGNAILTISGSTGLFTTGAGFENAATGITTTPTGNSRVTLTSGGTLKLSANVTALTTQSQFTLGTGGGVIDTNGSNTTLSGVVTGTSGVNATGITGVGSLTKTGSGTLTLTGVNTYTGGTTVNAGTVTVQNDQTLANGGWNIQTPNDGSAPVATVNFSTGSTIVGASANKIQIGAAANSGSYPASTLNVAGTVTNSGALQLERAGVLNLNSGAIWTQSGNLTVTGRGGASSTLNVNAGSNMTYSGSNTVKLNSAATSGGTGSLNIDGTGRFTTGAGFENLTTDITGSGVSRVRLTNGGTLRLSADVANLTTQTRFDLSTGGGVIDTNGFSTTLSGVTTVGSSSTAAGITGAGGLTKAGSGTLTLSGDNTYTGTTTISAGKLVVTDTIGGSDVTVSGSGAILASESAATIGKTLTVNTGAILAVGDAANAATTTATVLGATTLNNGSIFSWDINAAGTSYDKLVTTGVAGEVTAGDAVFRIVVADSTFANSFWTADRTWTDIFTTNGTTAIANWSTVFGNNVSVVNSGFTSITPTAGTFSITGSTLTWTAVPEPSGALVGLLFGAGLLRRRRN